MTGAGFEPVPVRPADKIAASAATTISQPLIHWRMRAAKGQ